MPELPATPLAAGRTAEIYAWGDGTVLKVFREWCPRAMVDHELRIARIVQAAGMAAPAPGEIVEIGGRVGMIYERLDGPSMLDTVMKRLWTVPQLARQMADLHVAMHGCMVSDLPSFSDALSHAIHSTEDTPDDLRAAAQRRLTGLPGGDRLCHGDFHPGNILMTSRGPIVIDWMTAAHGHPLADVARTVILLRSGSPAAGGAIRWFVRWIGKRFERAYLARYFALRPGGRERLVEWLPVIAAARLNEHIAGEREWLLDVIEQPEHHAP